MVTALAAIVTAILLVLGGLVSLAGLYLLILSVTAALNPRGREIDGTFEGQKTDPARFIVLIPAHDEELLIGDTLRRLSNLNYPSDRFEALVIADNCSDATAEIARRAGCDVLERTDPENPGKGQALDWAMQQHLADWPRPWEAVLVMDADSYLNPDCLWFLSEQFRAGHELLQAYYTVSNPQESWRTSLLTASLGLVHFLRPLGRDALGLPCGLKGNGFVMSRRLVLEYGYPARSNVEDVELALLLRTQGIGARFVPGARVYGQMTSSAEAAAAQRTRWEGGRIAMIRGWSAALLKRGILRGDAACLDGLIDLLIPPFALLATTTLAVLLFSGLLLLFIPESAAAVTFMLAAGAMGCQCAYTVTGLILIRAPALIWRRMLFAPVYVGWKVLLYAAMLAHPSRLGRWKRTERQARDSEQ
jgi:cellulose synthase/poly-beta-1,6-N-acetylglucosamine synthase-like glycosyltransferase